VPVNTVEGSARRGRAEFRHFLDIAFGSLAEVGYTLRFARDLGISTPDDAERLEAQRENATRLLFLLLRSMKAKL
jgi:four helix bundle protein